MASERLKQPAGLPILFFAELWERFGFYCIQALLVLFLTNKLLWSDKPAYDLFSAYSALIYATPVIGGYLADRWLGYRHAILLGGFLYLIGYLCLSSLRPETFDFALGALICGNGFFKPNVSTLLGKLYNDHDPRRESGFTWFYMGINIGTFLSPLTAPFVAKSFGWHYGFLTAAIGMLVCLSSCLMWFKKLGDKGLPPIKLSFSFLSICYGLVIAGIFLFAELLHHTAMTDDILIGLEILSFAVLLVAAFFQDKTHRARLIALIILIIFSVLFWAMYVQMFTSVTLFTERVVNRDFFGLTIPTGTFVGSEGFFIILLSPFFASLWLKLNRSGSRLNPSTPMKFAFGLICVGFGFLSLVLGIQFPEKSGMVFMGWLLLNYLWLTVGELSLSPIGLSAVTSLSPPKLVGMIMGVWFLSLSAAYAIGGKIADLTAIPSKIASDPLLSAPIYQANFLHFALISIGVAVVLILFVPVLKRMMHDEMSG